MRRKDSEGIKGTKIRFERAETQVFVVIVRPSGRKVVSLPRERESNI